jgi:hypothetical protein
MLLADGDYHILPEPEVEVSEETRNVAEELTEAPNPSSEELINIPDPSLSSDGKPRCITQYFKLLHYAIFYLYYIVHLSS